MLVPKRSQSLVALPGEPARRKHQPWQRWERTHALETAHRAVSPPDFVSKSLHRNALHFG